MPSPALSTFMKIYKKLIITYTTKSGRGQGRGLTTAMTVNRARQP